MALDLIATLARGCLPCQAHPVRRPPALCCLPHRVCQQGLWGLQRTSMLPVSGAEQLKISEANTTRPMTWLRYAYSCARDSSPLFGA